MKKLLIVLVGIVMLAVAAAFALPWLIDASDYRAEIARQTAAATGREIVIEGPVEFALLPSPRVRAFDVRARGDESGAAAATFAAKRVELQLGWGSLFGGAVEIRHLRLVEPQVTMKAPAGDDGAGVWPELGRITSIRIERTEIQNGRLVWINGNASARTVEQIQAQIAVTPLGGSTRITGSAVASAVPLEFDAILGDPSSGRVAPLTLSVNIRPSLARATLRGTYDPAGRQGVKGRLQVESADLFAALEALGETPPAGLAGALSQPFSATGEFVWANASVTLNDLALQLGETRVSGAVNATRGRTDTADIALAATWLDLDRLLSLERPVSKSARPTARPDAALAVARIDRMDRPRPLLEGFDVTLDLGVEAIGLGGGIVRQLHVNAVSTRGDIVFNKLSASLPGGTELSGLAQIAAEAGTMRIDGTLSMQSDNLRGLLGWMGIDSSGVPAGRLRRIEAKSRLQGTLARIELAGLDLAFDSSRASGGITIVPGRRPGLGIDLRLDQLNIDGYLAEPPTMPAASAPEAKATPLSLALLDRFDANLRLAAETVTLRGVPISGVVVDGTLQGGDLVLHRATAQELAGAALDASGAVAGIASRRDTDLRVTLRADDATRLLRLVDLKAPVASPLALSGRVKVPASGEIAVEDLDVAYGPVRATGRAKVVSAPAQRLVVELATEHLPLDALPRIEPGAAVIPGIDLALEAGAVSFGAHRLDNARLGARLENGEPAAIDLAGSLYGGALDLTVRSEEPDRGKLNGTLTLAKVDLRQALRAVADVEMLTGRADVRTAFSMPARLGSEMWSGVAGSIEFKALDGALDGIDIPLMRDLVANAQSQPDVVSLLGAGLNAGSTPYHSIDAAMHVDRGVMRVDSLRLGLDDTIAEGGGGADLGKGTLDLWIDLPIGGKDVPPVRLAVTGRVEEPSVRLDFARLQSFLARRQANSPGQALGGAGQ